MSHLKANKISTTQLLIQDVAVELMRKNVKNINLRITQPEGQVRVSAPKRMPIDLIYAFINSKYDWIVLQQKILQAYVNENSIKYEAGEKHFYLGEQYELQVTESNLKPKVIWNEQVLELYIKAEATSEQRQSVMESWYRSELKNSILILIKKYEHLMCLQVPKFGVKKMKTRWGTCNPKAKRIWLNLELIKKPIECLEYVVLHEMTHFLEPKHNQRLYDFVTEYMPEWKAAEKLSQR